MKFLAILAIVAILAAGAFLYQSHSEKNSVDLIYPQRGQVVQAVYATGTVEPSVMVTIAPRSTGRLMSLAVDEGQAVVKGQVLASLENSDLLQTLEEAEAKQNLAEKEYERKVALIDKGAVSRTVVDQSEAELQAAKATVERIKAQLDFLNMTAPDDGVIIRRDGEIGEIIAVNQPVLWMSCCAPLRVSAEVDEEDIPLVKVDQTVLLHADAYQNKIFKGMVKSITPKGDPVSRSYRVRIEILGDTPLMTGMTAEANIITAERKDVLLVPVTAVKDGQVIVAREGKAVSIPVRTGVKGRSEMEITEGLLEQDKVLRIFDEVYLHDGIDHAVIKDWKPDGQP
ncbi:MAG: efflux RND transporter periplasmic adaptor subunit [Micavibrio sp.]